MKLDPYTIQLVGEPGKFEVDDYVMVANLQLHREAKMEINEFLWRFSSVQEIRTSMIHSAFIYMMEKEDPEIWKFLHDAVHEGIAKQGPVCPRCWYIFAILLPPKLYAWLAANRFDTVLRHLYLYQAVLYCWGSVDKRLVIEDQLQRVVLGEILKIFESYLVPRAGQKAYHRLEKGSDKARKAACNDIEKIYNEAAIEFTGTKPPAFLFFSIQTMFHDRLDRLYKQAPQIYKDWGLTPIHGGFLKIGFVLAYMIDDDWQRIVIENKKDNLVRAESDRKTFEKWYMTYCGINEVAAKANELMGIVYVVAAGDTGRFKIGFTKGGCPSSRLSSLQTGCPEPLQVRGFFQVPGPEHEKVLHRIFNSKKISGEWFSLETVDVNNILDAQWRQSHGLS